MKTPKSKGRVFSGSRLENIHVFDFVKISHVFDLFDENPQVLDIFDENNASVTRRHDLSLC